MNNIWVESVVAGLLVTLIIVLVYRNFRAKVLFKELSEMYIQSLADKMLLEKRVEELYQDIENLKLQNSDGFLKFLSDSRDWAFNYIELTQKSLKEFADVIEPAITWSETYGITVHENAHSDKIKQISEAYRKLKEVLPRDTETPNN